MWSGSNSASAGGPSRARILQSLQERKRSRNNSLSSLGVGDVSTSGEPSSYGGSVSGGGGGGPMTNPVRGAMQPGGQPRSAPSAADPRTAMGVRGQHQHQQGASGHGPVRSGNTGSGLGAPGSMRPHGPGVDGQQKQQSFAPGPRRSGTLVADMGHFPPAQSDSLQHPDVTRLQPAAYSMPPPRTASPVALSTGRPLLAAQQQVALQHAHAQSHGYYIVQESSFGNLILPVLPRVDSVK
eukprot:scpid93748/ scgid22490/ 